MGVRPQREADTLPNENTRRRRADVADEAAVADPSDERAELEEVPIPASDTQSDHDRVRRSNDRDQRLEREGKPSAHNEGYDDAVEGR